MERKTFPAVVTKTDADQGIVSAVFAVFGNIDEGNDVVHPGAFAKTFAERGQKVLVLDQHQTDSIMRALGKPVSLRELERDDLPDEMKAQHPNAVGGAEAEIQFLMDTPEGKGAFIRLKAGAVSEWSFGYDVLDADFSKATRDGEEITIRNLRTLKLYEVSPVLWGMNQATLTTGAKSGEPTEGKPWGIIPQGDEFCVYRLDEEGEPVGETRGCHPTREEAVAQVQALYANVEEEGEETGKDTESTDIIAALIEALEARGISAEAIAEFTSVLDDKQVQEDGKDQRAGPSGEAPTPDEGAGPPESETPTQEDKLARIQIARSQLDLLEV